MRRTFRVRSMLRTLGPLLATCVVTMGILLAVTPADVKRVANKYLTAGRVALSVVPVGKADQASKPAESQSVK